jgi:hypothetical protein
VFIYYRPFGSSSVYLLSPKTKQKISNYLLQIK